MFHLLIIDLCEATFMIKCFNFVFMIDLLHNFMSNKILYASSRNVYVHVHVYARPLK